MQVFNFSNTQDYVIFYCGDTESEITEIILQLAAGRNGERVNWDVTSILVKKHIQTAKDKTLATAQKVMDQAEAVAAQAQKVLEDAAGERKEAERLKVEIEQVLAKKSAEWEKKVEVSEEVKKKQGNKVKLNVGGKIYTVSLDTIMSQKDTFLSALLSGRWLANPDDPNGSIFIDRDGTHYNYIFNYLRDRDKAVLPTDIHVKKMVAQEAEYLGLIGLKNKLTVGGGPELWRGRRKWDRIACVLCGQYVFLVIYYRDSYMLYLLTFIMYAGRITIQRPVRRGPLPVKTRVL